MPYGTVEAVLALIPGDREINNTTHPSTTDVETWIDQTSNTVDVALTWVEIDPATLTATQTDALTLAVCKEVAYLLMQSAGTSEGAKQIWAEEWHKDFLALIKKIEDGLWAESTDTDINGQPRSYTESVVDNSDNSPESARMQPKAWWGRRF